jgi:uncharacterized Zn finger protein (UPF0148 family)
MWVCSFGVPECPICKRNRLSAEETRKQEEKAKAIVERAQRALIAGSVTVKIDRLTGKVTFTGISQADRQLGASDECLLRAIRVSGSPLAYAKIEAAQRLAGRAISTVGK